MSQIVQLKDKSFKPFISAEEIAEVNKQLADRINADFEGKEVLFLAILNGSFVFAADLVREIKISNKISFVKVASYEGLSSSGTVKKLIGLMDALENRHVIILEDIIDTGHTLHQVLEILQTRQPKSLEVCCLLNKPSRREADVNARWIGFDIPDAFVVGYGIDYAQNNRHLPHIGAVRVKG